MLQRRRYREYFEVHIVLRNTDLEYSSSGASEGHFSPHSVRAKSDFAGTIQRAVGTPQNGAV